MPQLTSKYKASTLIEVLVAMIIILICAGMGTTAVSNLSRDMNGNMEIKAAVFMDKILSDTKTDKDYTDKIFEVTGLRIERSVFPYKKEKRLRILQIEAYNTLNKKVGEVKQLIMILP